MARRRWRITPAAKMRVGIGLWLFSWFPLAGLTLLLVETSEHTVLHPGIYGVEAAAQYAIGLVALILAGSETVKIVRKAGVRGTPSVIWALLIHGRLPDDAQHLLADDQPHVSDEPANTDKRDVDH